MLKEIEEKYPVDTILVNGEQVWPYLRIAYDSVYVRRMTSESGEEQPGSPSPGTLAHMVKNSFYGLSNWFHKYDYVVLSNTNERRRINGKYVNKLLDPIIDELGRDKVLYVEAPAPLLYPAKRVHTRNIVCSDLLTLLAAIWTRIVLKGCVIQNGFILDTIQREYGLEIDDAKRIRLFSARKGLFDFLLRRIKPKALLLSCYYVSYLPAVKAAKDLGIKVVEVQHGVIGKEHPAYNVHRDLDRSYFPDHLLVFGKQELATFDNSRFIEPTNVHPVGSYYIDYIRANYTPDPQLSRRLSGYKRVVGVTLQWTFERRLINFVCAAAKLDCDMLYILIPRRSENESYAAMNLPANVLVVRERNFYELMMHCDFHSTVNSTCALEAPSLGVQNILVDIDGSARAYYGEVLTDNRVTRFADTAPEYVDVVENFARLDRNLVCGLNEDFFAANYQENVNNFVKTYLL